ncbi:hypothetical protein B0H19DRAFT_1245576 [Mycena capillaripes]|nr:hypothetical protein B0H19DRAFT_1245576 [Mycena capillaripes]
MFGYPVNGASGLQAKKELQLLCLVCGASTRGQILHQGYPRTLTPTRINDRFGLYLRSKQIRHFSSSLSSPPRLTRPVPPTRGYLAPLALASPRIPDNPDFLIDFIAFSPGPGRLAISLNLFLHRLVLLSHSWFLLSLIHIYFYSTYSSLHLV